jgi:hypothetical protein
MWLSIIIIGTLVSIFIWVLQRRKWSWKLRLFMCVGLIVCLVISLYIFSAPVVSPLGKDSWYNRSPYLEIIFFICMAAGMAFRYITHAIEERRKKIIKLKKESRKVKKPELEFDIWEFSYPFFFSVVTFGLLLKQVEVEEITISNIILSFQSGFFWQTILKKEIKYE